MQHKILKRGRSQCRFFYLDVLLFLLHRRREARCDYLEALIVDPAAQRLQPFLMSRLVGIHFRRPVQTLAGFLVVVLGAIQVKQFQQRLRVVGFTVRRVKQLGQKFQHLRRRTVRRQKFLHGDNERSPLATAPLERLQFPRQRHRLRIQFGVDHLSDQAHHLMDARRVLLEQLPDQGLAIHTAIRQKKRLRV